VNRSKKWTTGVPITCALGLPSGSVNGRCGRHRKARAAFERAGQRPSFGAMPTLLGQKAAENARRRESAHQPEAPK